MKGIPAKVKKVLQAARLWDGPCLMCGSSNDIEAEHAFSGMGYRSEDAWDIIPLCRTCHRGGPSGGHMDKAFARNAAQVVRWLLDGELDPPMGPEISGNQFIRISNWTVRLKNALEKANA